MLVDTEIVQIGEYPNFVSKVLVVLLPLYRSLDLEETVSATENADGTVEMDTHSILEHSVEEYRVNGKLRILYVHSRSVV